ARDRRGLEPRRSSRSDGDPRPRLHRLRPPRRRSKEPRHPGAEGGEDVPFDDLLVREARPRPLLRRRRDVLDRVRGRAREGKAGVDSAYSAEDNDALTTTWLTSSGAPSSRTRFRISATGSRGTRSRVRSHRRRGKAYPPRRSTCFGGSSTWPSATCSSAESGPSTSARPSTCSSSVRAS